MKKPFYNFMLNYRYVTFPIFGIVTLAIFGGALMILWNWLMPSIFGLTTIDYWQAIGLFALARLLFSGLGFLGGYKGDYRGYGYGSDSGRENWMKMTAEERGEWFKNRGYYDDFYPRYGHNSKTNKKENDKSGNE